MKITWHGQGCFQIVLKERGKPRFNITIDPFDSDIKIKIPWKKADILLLSQKDSRPEGLKGTQEKPFLITGPGEYEIGGILVQGIDSFCKGNKKQKKTTVFIVEAEEMRLCYLGSFCQKELTPDQLDKIGDVDILMIPVGGVSTVDTGEALKIISQIEPRIVIPMHYHIPGLKPKRETVGDFLKVFGAETVKAEKELLIKTTDLPKEEETKVLVLKL